MCAAGHAARVADPLLFVPSQFPRFGEEVRFDFTARATGLAPSIAQRPSAASAARGMRPPFPAPFPPLLPIGPGSGLTATNETVAIAASFADAQGVRWAATPDKTVAAPCPLVGAALVCDVSALTFGPDFARPGHCTGAVRYYRDDESWVLDGQTVISMGNASWC